MVKWLWGLALAGLGLRLAALGGALWYDEAFSAWLATLPAGQLLQATMADVHPPGYYFILREMVNLLGNTAAAVRLPSLIAGMLLIFVAYRLAVALGLNRAGVIIVTGLTALAPFQIYYSTEARMYALQMLALALAAWGIISRAQWSTAAAVLGCLAALYLLHISAVFVAVWLLAAVLCDPQRWKHWAFVAGAIAIGYAPGLLLAVDQAGRVGSGYWILPIESPGAVVGSLDGIIFGTANTPFITGMVTSLGLALVLADLPRLWQRRRLPLLLALGPLLIISVISILWRPLLINRVLAPSAVFLYIILADVVSQSPRRVLVWAGSAAAFLIAVNLTVLAGDAGRTPVEDLTKIDYRHGDGVYHTNVGSLVDWHYYLPQADHYLWPQNNGLSQSLTNATKEAMGMQQADFETVKCRHARWWYISYSNPTSTPGELAYTAHLIAAAKETAVLRSDIILDSRVYLIERGCQITERR